MVSIDIDVKGLEEIQKELKVDTIPELNDWAKRIVERVTSQMSISQSEIHLRFVEKGPKELDIEFRASEKHIEPLIRVLEELLPQMPIRTRTIFQALLDTIKKEKNAKE